MIFSTAFSQNLLRNPESIVYDSARSRYLVSNYANGYIVQIDSLGAQSYYSDFLAESNNIIGIYILNDVLYTAVDNGPYQGVCAFDLASGNFIRRYVIPEQNLVNDITSDGNGFLYVTDYYDSKIYKIDLWSGNYTVFASYGLYNPNGILIDLQHNRLLTVGVSGPGYPIIAVDLSDSSASILYHTGLSGMDGITFDSQGRIYISDWTSNSVFSTDTTFLNPMELFASGLNAPADIYYDSVNTLLAVPNFYGNSIEFSMIPLNSVGGNLKTSQIDSYKMLPVFPNPFNAKAMISLTIPTTSDVIVDITDIAGKSVSSLRLGALTPGEYSIPIDGNNLPSGVYFLRLNAGNYSQTQKIILMK